MNTKHWFVSLAFALPLASLASPAAACPEPVKAAIGKLFPKSTVTTCKSEKEHGTVQWEVKVQKADTTKAEVDVSPEGKVLQIEEKVALASVPAAVMKAFAAKYPKAQVDQAEKQTPSEGPASYELAFKVNGGRKEATFTETGKFVEEE